MGSGGSRNQPSKELILPRSIKRQRPRTVEEPPKRSIPVIRHSSFVIPQQDAP